MRGGCNTLWPLWFLYPWDPWLHGIFRKPNEMWQIGWRGFILMSEWLVDPTVGLLGLPDYDLWLMVKVWFLAVGCSLGGVVGVGSAEARCALWLGRRGGQGLPPPRPAYRSQPPRPTKPTPSTHKVDNLTTSPFQLWPFFNRTIDGLWTPASMCSQVSIRKESDWQFYFPMTSLVKLCLRLLRIILPSGL